MQQASHLGSIFLKESNELARYRTMSEDKRFWFGLGIAILLHCIIFTFIYTYRYLQINPPHPSLIIEMQYDTEMKAMPDNSQPLQEPFSQPSLPRVPQIDQKLPAQSLPIIPLSITRGLEKVEEVKPILASNPSQNNSLLKPIVSSQVKSSGQQANSSSFEEQKEALKRCTIPKIEYPLSAKRRGEQGKTLIDLTILSDGSITGIALIKSSGFSDLDEAAMRIVHLMRCHTGQAQKNVQATLPILYHLNSDF